MRMNIKKLLLLFIVFSSHLDAAVLYDYRRDHADNNEFVWEKVVADGFRELLFSFNAILPAQGHYDFYIRVHSNGWSQWEHIIHWGCIFRESRVVQNEFFSFAEDTLTTLAPCDRFAVHVRPCNGALLANIEFYKMILKLSLGFQKFCLVSILAGAAVCACQN